MAGEKTIWDEFIHAMKRYFEWYYVEEFEPIEMIVLNESRLYSDNDEIYLDIWFVYGSKVFNVVVSYSDHKVDIRRYDLKHSMSITDESIHSKTH